MAMTEEKLQEKIAALDKKKKELEKKRRAKEKARLQKEKAEAEAKIAKTNAIIAELVRMQLQKSDEEIIEKYSAFLLNNRPECKERIEELLK